MLLVIGLIVTAGCPNSNDLRSQLKKAKSGDWTKHNATSTMTMTVLGTVNAKTGESTVLEEVISNDGKMLRLRETTTSGTEKGSNEIIIDMSQSLEEIAQSMFKQGLERGIYSFPGDVAIKNLKIEFGKSTTDSISVAGKKYNCVVEPMTVTGTFVVAGNADFPGATANFTASGTGWRSPAVSIGGLVKSEMEMNMEMNVMEMKMNMKANMTQTLDSFGKGGR